jgi:hypothetical protein
MSNTVVKIGEPWRITTLVGPCRITWSRDGSSSLSFAVKPSTAVDPFELVQVYEDDRRIFLGRCKSPVYDEERGVVTCVADDMKVLIGDLPLAAHTSDGPAGRHGMVVFTGTNYNTVSSIIKTIISECYNGNVDDGQELLTDYVPAAIAAAWVSAANLAAWDDLPALSPYTVTFAGDSVGKALNTLMGKYYPGWGWWVDPADGVIKPWNSFDDAYSSFDTIDLATARRVFVNGIMPSMDGVYSRVIVEGRYTTEVALTGTPTTAAPFVTDDLFRAMERQTWFYDHSEQSITFTRTTCSNVDKENLKLVVTVTPIRSEFADLPSGHDESGTDYEIAGAYSKDVRCLASSGYGGDAYEEYNLKRTLRIQDDSFGVILHINSSTGLIDSEDRRGDMSAYCAAIHAVVSKIRYTGSMRYKANGTISPLRRVRLLNHARYGTLEFMPQSITYDCHTGMRTYQLGDAKYSPIEELKLLQELRWQKKGASGRVIQAPDKRMVR